MPPEVEAPDGSIAESSCPRRSRYAQVLDRRRAHRREFEAHRPPSVGDPRLRRSVQDGDPLDAIGQADGHEELDVAARRDDRRHTTERHRVQAHDASEQRAPGHRNGDERRGPRQLPRQGLGRLRQEDRVGRAATRSTACGTTRRLGHPGGVGVDTDDDGSRLGSGARKHRPTVARAEIDDNAVGSGDLLVDLADVDLEDAPADDLFHGGNCIGRT
jgi:hypothetical protein